MLVIRLRSCVTLFRRMMSIWQCCFILQIVVGKVNTFCAKQHHLGGRCKIPVLITCDQRYPGSGKWNGSQQTGSGTRLVNTVITAAVSGVFDHCVGRTGLLHLPLEVCYFPWQVFIYKIGLMCVMLCIWVCTRRCVLSWHARLLCT